ncbi:MAG: hypothetical protein Q4G68_07445 [Planctomycetia bacterium]|nr:hypothetical protein [Planctomycetia bacterium]
MKKFNWFCMLIVSIIFAAGCGNEHNLHFAQGTVLIDGKPEADVSVTFIPAESGTGLGAGGTTDTEGKFLLSSTLGKGGDGTQPGLYKVIFSKLAPEREPTEAEKARFEKDPDDKVFIPLIDLLPAKYTSPKTTDIEAEITAGGPNTFVFELKSKTK